MKASEDFTQDQDPRKVAWHLLAKLGPPWIPVPAGEAIQQRGRVPSIFLPPHVFVFLSSSPYCTSPPLFIFSIQAAPDIAGGAPPIDASRHIYTRARAPNGHTHTNTSNSSSPSAWRRHGFPVESRTGARSASPLLPIRRDHACRVGQEVHHHQQVRGDGVAGGDARGQLQRGRVRAQDGGVIRLHGAAGVVGPHLGPHGLRLRPGRHRQVRHGLLRRGPQVRRVRRPAGKPGRVHARLPGLLRREPRGRLQPAHHGHPRERARQLLGGRVRRRPPGHLPRRALREGPQRQDGGVPERLRRVQHRPVLLPRQVRGSLHLPAHAILQEVQGGMPVGIQLRLRRPQQPLPVLRRRLHHHLLRKQEAIGVHAPRQQARVQRLKPTPADHVRHDAAGAARQLRGNAVCHVIQDNRIQGGSRFIFGVWRGNVGDVPSFITSVFNRLSWCEWRRGHSMQYTLFL